MRPALRRFIEQEFGQVPHRRIEEWCLPGARADVAVFSHQHFDTGRRGSPLRELRFGVTVFEIKSDADSFERLAAQAAAYCDFADALWLVLTEKQSEKFNALLVQDGKIAWNLVHAGKIVVRGEDFEVKSRPRTFNLRSFDPLMWLQLLAKDQVLAICRRIAPEKGLQRRVLLDVSLHLIHAAPAPVIQQEVLREIMGKDFGLRVELGWRKAQVSTALPLCGSVAPVKSPDPEDAGRLPALQSEVGS